MSEAPADEEREVRAARDGDLAAFEALVLRWQPLVMSAARRLVGSESEAEDVSQEVWLRVHRSLRRFQFQSAFSTWLYRIVVNQSISALRKRKNLFGARRRDVALDAEDAPQFASREPGPRRRAEAKESLVAFRKALAALSFGQRAAVTLVLLEGLSHREAGEILGCREKTVSWRLFKARERLLDLMEEHLR